MDLEELNVYRLSMDIGERVWAVVIKWDFFAKDTIGKQLVRAADSVSANLSEGFGRFFYKESKQFCYYSRGSLYETKTFLNKAYNRCLISKEEYECFVADIKTIGIKLNNYIKSIGKSLDNSMVKDDSVTYGNALYSVIDLEEI
jgi:four helix bundle protein